MLGSIMICQETSFKKGNLSIHRKGCKKLGIKRPMPEGSHVRTKSVAIDNTFNSPA